MATYQILHWYDIPVQVRASEGRNRQSVPLSNRFQEAIDSAAMAAGLFGSDGYTERFVWGPTQERAGAPGEVAAAVAAELEAAYPEIDWRATAEKIKQERGE